MERLTERYKDSVANVVLVKECGSNCCKDICEDASNVCSKCSLNKVFEKLADYEDAEEQGLLLKLPCKEAFSQSGDIVYLIYDYCIIECVHCGLSISPTSGEGFILLATEEDIFPYRSPDPEHDLDPTDWCTNITDVEVSEIGKTLFFTREEAEKKLRGLENESIHWKENQAVTQAE